MSRPNLATKLENKKKKLNYEWYSLRSILGYSWAIFLMLLGGREAGKSYSVTDFFCRQWRKYGRPFYWLRLSDTSQQKLLKNNAEKLIDENGEPFTAHTTNPVPFILVNYDEKYTLKENGKLCDIVPTLIDIMGLEKPADMTGESLLTLK